MKNNSIIEGIECAKMHSGNHTLFRVGKYAECQGCGEYYTFLEISQAESHSAMLARGVRRLTVQRFLAS